MEVIEVADGFSLEKEESKACDAVRQGAQERVKMNGLANQESKNMFASTSLNMPAPPRAAARGAEIADTDRAEHQKLVIALSRYGSSKRFAEYLKSMQFNLNVGHLRKQPEFR